MSWRGIDGAITAAQAGHDTVLSPAPILYFDNRQSVGARRAAGPRQARSRLADVYAFDPRRRRSPPAQQRHILGLQAQSLDRAYPHRGRARAYMAFPRALAVAELGWSPAGARDFAGFVGAAAPQLERLRALGLQPRRARSRPDGGDALRSRPAGSRSRCPTRSAARSATRSTARRPPRAPRSMRRRSTFASAVAAARARPSRRRGRCPASSTDLTTRRACGARQRRRA